ncbi:MAG: DUF3761 domain-containing protein [Acidobacteriota bacterium]
MSAQAPAGSTGQCKDGTYTSAASKSGACRGHKGIQTWFAGSATSGKGAKSATTAPAAAPTPAPAAAPTPAPEASAPTTGTHRSSAATGPAAPGGGPGLVWVNSTSNVYHCYGTKYYGTTKAGKYMTEAAAKAAGARPDHGNACSK